MNELKQLSPQQAYARIQENKNSYLIDIRSRAEIANLGYPQGCVFANWTDEPSWTPNVDEFIMSVIAVINANNAADVKDTEIILICRSGQRSHAAGDCLINTNFTNVGHVFSGFEGDADNNNIRNNINGWQYDGMPCNTD